MTGKSPPDTFIMETLELAEKIQLKANSLVKGRYRKFQKQIRSFLKNPGDKILFIKLIDRGLRTKRKDLSAEYIYGLFREGIPSFLTPFQRLLSFGFVLAGRFFPSLSIPIMHRYFRNQTRHIILPAEWNALNRHLKKRDKEKVLININRLGEAILGEEEASARFDDYIKDIKRPEIHYISVKISGILSQIKPIAYEYNIVHIKARLTDLFRTAKDFNTFVNIDMEEYNDLEITVRSFMEVLDSDEFLCYSAGIALQAYIPDSSYWQETITRWALSRMDRGGKPVKIRLVKGANLEMELLESELMGWPLPMFGSKKEVDAHYKKMLEYGLRRENIRAVQIGVASHNIFDLAYSLKLAEKYGVHDKITIEMLEGMADHIRKALSIMVGDGIIHSVNILLYSPVVAGKDFINAMAYLVRRLDENTSEENFLSHSFSLAPGTEEWDFLKKQYLDSLDLINSLSLSSSRSQDRGDEDFQDTGSRYRYVFINEPDTDWSLAPNRDWAMDIRRKWKKSPGLTPDRVPLVAGGREIHDGRETGRSIDRSVPDGSVISSEFVLGNDDDIHTALLTARSDPDGWRELSHRERRFFLSKAARELRRTRGDLIGAMAAVTGKVFTEADPEVSEAVDFTEFYPYSIDQLEKLSGLEFRGKGVGLVISPWNFPVAIPTGGLVAALASGNTVIFKPSSESVLVAYLIAQCFWKTGISGNTLQFLPCRGSLAGRKLADSNDIDFIILTGGTDTAMKIISERPDLYLAAETGGKNATIVTSMADYDQAIGNIIHSAFSNCGQKCSATSLLVLVKEVFRDPVFKKQLLDAVSTYRSGSQWDFQNRIGPLIATPQGDLQKAIEELEPGESWAIGPEKIDNNPYIWKPAVKWNVRPGSHCHLTELFGPVLSVMEAEDLEHAIDIVNSTGYGLTSGLESLDEKEQQLWISGIKAGNLYINRVTTGAVVLRQPFGGMGKSAIGSGIKAGGPNYTFQFMEYTETGPPSSGPVSFDHPVLHALRNLEEQTSSGKWTAFTDEINTLKQAVHSYLWNFQEEFSREKDYFKLRGQDNIFRYIPHKTIAVRLHDDDSLFSVLARIAATRIAGSQLIVSIPAEADNDITAFLYDEANALWMGRGMLVRQSEKDLTAMIPEISLIRYAAPGRVPEAVFREAANTGFYISRTPVLAEGRIELLQYFQEQSISHNYHRYGNLGIRAPEFKK